MAYHLNETSKECTKCCDVKCVSLFQKDATKNDGLHPHCKACRKQHRDKNKEYYDNYAEQYRKDNKKIINKKMREYNKKNKERISMNHKQYYLDNKERLNEYAKKNYRENIEKNREDAKKRYYENIDRRKVTAKAWRETNKEEIRFTKRLESHLRREKVREVDDGTITKKAILDMLEAQKWMCNICDVDLMMGYHIDHIIPISKEGIHSISNIQILCPLCNMSKGAKILLDNQKNHVPLK